MATSFTIQDILSSCGDKRPPALNLASSSSSGAAAKKSSSQQQQHEVTVIESRNLSENKSLRKRSRDYASSESSASSSTLEGNFSHVASMQYSCINFLSCMQ